MCSSDLKLLPKILVHLGSTRVNGVRGIVSFFSDQLLEFRDIGHTDTPVVSQNSFSILGETGCFVERDLLFDSINALMAFLGFLDLIH